MNAQGVRGDRLSHISCPWYINSKDHGHCFWIYVLDKKMRKDHSNAELASLFKTSTSNIRTIEEETLRKIKDSLIHLAVKAPNQMTTPSNDS